MPDDALFLRGFLRFENDDFNFKINIANERAVDVASCRLNKEFPVEAAFGGPGNAVNAVQAAALRKADIRDQLDDNPNVVASEFFVESFDLL